MQITAETVRPSNRWPLTKLQTFPEIYPRARLIRHILYSIMSAWVNLDSSKSRARIALVMSSVTSLQTNRQDVDISKLSKVTNQKVYQELVYRNEVFKTMLTGSPVAPSFSTRPGLSPPPHFQSSRLTESLEQVRTLCDLIRDSYYEQLYIQRQTLATDTR